MPRLGDALAVRVGASPASALYVGAERVWPATDPGSDEITFAASTAIIPNPERGFFQYTETHYREDLSGHSALNSTTLATARTTLGRTLVFRYFVIERYLTRDTIEETYLDLLDADLAAVRAAGCKVIPRFAYTTLDDQPDNSLPEPPYGSEPPLARLLGHIEQLAPVLNEHAPVIEAVQAGFIGVWGEWYYSDNFGDEGSTTPQQWADRIAVLNALHDNLDPSIYVLVRYPAVKMRWFA